MHVVNRHCKQISVYANLRSTSPFVLLVACESLTLSDLVKNWQKSAFHRLDQVVMCKFSIVWCLDGRSAKANEPANRLGGRNE